MPTIRASVLEDAALLAPFLRPIDAEECLTGSHSPLEALELGINTSDKCWTVVDPDGTILAVFGVRTVQAGLASAWLLMREEFFKYRRRFVRESFDFIKEMKAVQPVLFNYIDVRNTKSLKWLQSLGFTATHLEPEYGKNKLPYYLIVS